MVIHSLKKLTLNHSFQILEMKFLFRIKRFTPLYIITGMGGEAHLHLKNL